jgi:hypothetical protein
VATAIDTRSLLEIAQTYTQPGILIQATIEGLAPGLLMHSGDAQRKQQQAAEEAKRKGLRGKFIPTTEQEAEWGAYRVGDDPEGALYLPGKNLRRSIVEASKAFKMPKSRSSMMRAVAAGVTTPQECSPGFTLHEPGTTKPITEYVIDVQRAVVAKASIQRARPLVLPWACDAAFLLDTEAVLPEVFSEILGYAGARMGVCDQRPEKGGEYGRFTVTDLAVVEELGT